MSNITLAVIDWPIELTFLIVVHVVNTAGIVGNVLLVVITWMPNSILTSKSNHLIAWNAVGNLLQNMGTLLSFSARVFGKEFTQFVSVEHYRANATMTQTRSINFHRL